MREEITNAEKYPEHFECWKKKQVYKNEEALLDIFNSFEEKDVIQVQNLFINEIETLIEQAYQHCKEKHGDMFNSLHEAESVLREEIEEAQEDVSELWDMHIKLWLDMRENKADPIIFESIEEQAIKAIQELAQVVGVCRKALNGFKGDK